MPAALALKGATAWRGLRLCCLVLLLAPSLAAQQHSLTAAYTGDAFAVHRAQQRRASAVHHFDASAALFTTSAESDGTTLYLRAFASMGSGPTEGLGDWQGVSNIEAPASWRVFEAWAEHRRFSGGLNVRAGLYDLNSEFYVTEAAALFLNGAQGIGPELSGSGQAGASVYPNTTAALRVRIAPADDFYTQVVVLDGVPDAARGLSALRVRLDLDEGALFVSEAGYQRAAAKVAMGAWRYSSPFSAFGADAAPRVNRGAYVLGEWPLVPGPDGAAPGLVAFARAGLADARVHSIAVSWGAGIVSTGLLPGRDADTWGLALAAAHFGTPYREAEAARGAPRPAPEYAFEFTYAFPVGTSLTLQPDVQYLLHPGGRARRGAAALGLRATLAF